MRNNYAEDAADAAELIEEFGQPGFLRRYAASGSKFDPTMTPNDMPVFLVALDYKRSEIDGTRILATDRKVYLSTDGLTVEPELSDRMVIGGSECEIVSISPLAPAGVVVFYEIQARR